ATTTATIAVMSGRDIVAGDDSYATSQDVMLTVTAPGVLGNDSHAEGAPLTAVLNSDAAHGTLSLAADGSLTYTPADGFVGSDAFTYVASDGIEHSNVATVAITVSFSGVVQAVDDSYTTPIDTTLAVATPGVLGNDLGGPGLWAFKRSSPAGGSVVLLYDGSFTYVPNPGFVGSDSFTYDFWDGENGEWSNLATVHIEVARVDLDIGRFRATKRADLSRFDGITLTLQVHNNGSVSVPDRGFAAAATITGSQHGVEVYGISLPIGQLLPGATTQLEIRIVDPGPFTTGEVVWTADLDVPGDVDTDEATATTKLVD
ncbi:MAG: Ig-like domain-containing protein, partial [Acidimicrobiia bacterium]|nr:Ig-like domain-containing protein [Acidimicrobiia bacterium]